MARSSDRGWGGKSPGDDGPSELLEGPDESVSMELIRRIRAGDPAGWEELYRRYHDQLLLAVRVRLGPGLRRYLESEDIFQSVALEAFRDLERFEYRGEGSLEAYLRTLVVHKIRDRVDTFGAAKRAGAVPLDDALADSLADGEPRYADAARYERLERALNALPEESREVIVLRKLEGLSSKEVAERLGTSDAAARKAYSRAMARLATALSTQADL